ncbi:MAG: SDR family oxidoreductase [Gammaproteobacteria bacterium]|nr:SDR family oxidoreductase [Gammaproteobacteria bacterium]MBI5618712.1 SDR family oxidoreductase [Gammaproteobacteria bacterium]
MRLKDQVAVITGGASGMGQAATLLFLEEGAQVVVADYNAENGAVTVELAKQRGYGDAMRFVRADVSQEADVAAMIGAACETFGRLDVLFNNAGVGGAIGPVWDIEEAEWDYTFDVLAKGVFFGIKHGARAMRRQGTGGAIVNTASIAGLTGGCGPLVYSAAKAAVINLTRSAAVQLAPDRIRVNAICPGAIQTGLVRLGGGPEETARILDEFQPWPEHGRSEDIAGAALFLASAESRFVTGEHLVVDGGISALGPEIWSRMHIPREREMTKSRLNKGTTGEATTARSVKS